MNKYRMIKNKNLYTVSVNIHERPSHGRHMINGPACHMIT